MKYVTQDQYDALLRRIEILESQSVAFTADCRRMDLQKVVDLMEANNENTH